MNSADIEAIARFRRGADPRALVQAMVADGFEEGAAEAAIERVRARITKEDRSRGVMILTVGLILLSVGLGLTVWTYMSAGETYVVAWGPALFGLIATLKGASQIADAGKVNHGSLPL